MPDRIREFFDVETPADREAPHVDFTSTQAQAQPQEAPRESS